MDTTITAEGAVNPDATVSKSIDPDLAKGNASENHSLREWVGIQMEWPGKKRRYYT